MPFEKRMSCQFSSHSLVLAYFNFHIYSIHASLGNTLLNKHCRLKQANIIPDTLDDFVPSCYLHAVYTSSHEVVRLGGKLNPSHTKKAPVVRISCPNAIDMKGFTVALTDPDAPSRKDPEWSEMCHWIVIVPGSGSSLQDGEEHWDEMHKRPEEIIGCTAFPHFPSFSMVSFCITENNAFLRLY